MKKYGLQFILLVGLIFTLTQCESAKKGEMFANTFFKAIVNQEFDKAANMVEVPAVGNTIDVRQQVEALGNNPTNGQLKAFKKGMGFNSNIVNGVATVTLNYRLKYDNGERTVEVVVRDSGNGFKVIAVQ